MGPVMSSCVQFGYNRKPMWTVSGGETESSRAAIVCRAKEPSRRRNKVRLLSTAILGYGRETRK